MRNHFSLIALIAALGLSSLTGCDSRPAGQVGIHEGQLAPAFSALSSEGRAVTLEDLGSKPAVLVFWASWCGPCRAEMPHINGVVKDYGDRVSVYGVNMGEDIDTVKQMGAAMDYPSLLDPTAVIAGRYAVSTIPLVLILDADGRIRYRGNGLPSRAHVLLDGLLG